MKDKILLILICCIATFYYWVTPVAINPNVHFFGALGVVSLVISLWSWYKRGQQLLSPYIIFLIVLYIFSYGIPLLYAFGITPERDLIGYLDISTQDLYDSQWLTIDMLVMFHLGALFYVDKHPDIIIANLSIYEYEDFIDQEIRLKKIGWILFVISAYFYISEIIEDMIFSLTYGYAAMYERGESIGLGNATTLLSDMFIPSIICLYVVYRDNNFVRHILTSIILINIVVIFITGGRTDGVILLALLLILYNSLVRHFNKKDYTVIACGTLILLSVLTAVSSTRNESNRSMNAGDIDVNANTIVSAIAEMGGSQSCLIKTMGIIPDMEDYKYGKSYLYSFTTIIPNLGFWDIHPAKKESNLSDWLTNKLGLSYGTGFSMTAEAYANFGYFGILLIFALGYFFAKIFSGIDQYISNGEFAKFVFLLIIFWFTLKLPRNCFIGIVRPFFYYAGPIYLFCTKFKFR